MKNWFQTLSFNSKQVFLIMLINAFTLAIASSILFSNYIANHEDNLKASLQSKAVIIKATSTSALLFHDKSAAQNILRALSHDVTIQYADIYDADQTLFARYLRNPESLPNSLTNFTEGQRFSNYQVSLLEAIKFGDNIVGYIHIVATTEKFKIEIKESAQIVITVFLLSLLVGFVLSQYMQQHMYRPIKQLVDIASYVAAEKKYDRRLGGNRSDEIGTLIHGFNTMLDTIEGSERQLKQHGAHLEDLVELRTEQLRTRANYDGLTELPNRHLLVDRLEHGIENARQEDRPLALLFLDLDRFKVVNDNFGHAIGDELLAMVANRLSSLISSADTVARWGGDEFVIFLEHLRRPEDAAAVAEKIIAALEEPFQLADTSLHISTSIGISLYPKDAQEHTTLLKHADISMYRAKALGAGNFAFYRVDMHQSSAHRLEMEAQLHNAIRDGDFFLEYQPKIDAKTGQVVGVEALTRWQDKKFGVVSPQQFIPIAEEVGLINRLGLWVLEHACEQHMAWQNQGLAPLPIAVNISPSQLVDASIADRIFSTLKKVGMKPQYLELEITESSFVDVPEPVIIALQRLKQAGVSIAIDDFGAGYSCLRYLRDFPVDVLKIDGSFIQGIGDGKGNDGIIAATIMLGRSLNLTVVAEWVENQAQFELLQQLDCDIIQGFYYSRPLPAMDVVEYIQASAVSKE